MSVNIKQLDGTLKKVAGNTIILDATASEIREGVITAAQIGTVEGESYKTLEITLSPAMPDTKYFVVFNGSTNSNFSVVAQRPETGKFYCTFRNTISTSVTADMDCHWYAVRLVELEGYTALQNKVNNPDSTPTDNSTNLVTSGGVYDAIKNASSVFIGTSSEWESETAKTDYQLCILTDRTQVNAVDSTTGNTEVVANKNLVFKGTLEEWEALTTAEKKTYDEALITNDMDTGEVVNGVTDGDMRAVTSNAVANFLAFEDVSFSINIAAQGRNYSYVNIPSKSGYTAKLVSLKDLAAPIDLAGIMVYSCLNPSTGKCLVVIHNDITSSQTVTGIVTILYIKN